MAAIAQLVEQLTCNEKVQGSTPCGGTILLGLSGETSDGLISRYGSGVSDLRYGENPGVNDVVGERSEWMKEHIIGR